MITTLSHHILYQDRYFTINQSTVDLANGAVMDFEYASWSGSIEGAVMVIPYDNEGYFYFVKMFQIGVGVDTITFPKGGIKLGFSPEQSALEELQEEVGFGAQTYTKLGQLYSHPGRATRNHHIILAQGLYPSSLSGDELETIEVLKLNIDTIKSMIMNGEINDAKTVASFYMSLEYLDL